MPVSTNLARSTKLAGIGIGAALALFALATPGAAADTGSAATSFSAGSSSYDGPGPIIVLPPKRGPNVPPVPKYTTMCGFCAGAI